MSVEAYDICRAVSRQGDEMVVKDLTLDAGLEHSLLCRLTFQLAPASTSGEDADAKEQGSTAAQDTGRLSATCKRFSRAKGCEDCVLWPATGGGLSVVTCLPKVCSARQAAQALQCLAPRSQPDAQCVIALACPRSTAVRSGSDVQGGVHAADSAWCACWQGHQERGGRQALTRPAASQRCGSRRGSHPRGPSLAQIQTAFHAFNHYSCSPVLQHRRARAQHCSGLKQD